MSRPFDWAPLAAADPLPGDPVAIREQAAGLRNVAVEIGWQVEQLRRIGGDAGMRALSVGALQAEALGVARRLEQVIGRYSRTAGCLRAWADELEGFQHSTVQVLARAQEAERRAGRDPHRDLAGGALFGYQGSAGVGELELAAARRELVQIVAEAAARDRYWAGRIGAAIDDKLTDGFWDGVRHWVERHKRLVEDFTNVLGWATTAAAFAAMAFPPLGAGVLGLSAVGLAVHGVEYEAGEGSLVDVGMDIAGLASFGAGKLISGRLEETFLATRTAAAEAAGQKAADAVREAESAGRMLTARNALQHAEDGVEARALAKGSMEAQKVIDAPSADVGFWRSFWAGSREDAHYLNDTRNLLAEYSEDAAVQRAGARLERLSIAGKANWIPATILDLNDKATGYVPGLPYGERYGRWKEHFVRTEGTFE